MKFKGFDNAKLEIKKTKDGDHDHMEIIKDGELQWYFHIFDGTIHVFTGYALANPLILSHYDYSGRRDMLILKRDTNG